MMTTPRKTEEVLRESEGSHTLMTRIKRWLAVPANVTRGWLLLSVALGFLFLGCAIYAAVQTVKLDNRVTQEQVAEAIGQQVTTCVNTNVRRMESAEVANLDIDADQEALSNDRENWDAIGQLFDDGIPEPVRSTIYTGLEERQAKIEVRRVKVATTYAPSDCSLIDEVISSPAN
jgi:hypothetical protein